MTNPGTATATENRMATFELPSAVATLESGQRENTRFRFRSKSIARIRDSSYRRNLKKGLIHTWHQYNRGEYALRSLPRDGRRGGMGERPGN